MSHSSEKRWAGVSQIASDAAKLMVDGLLEAESKYQDLLELYAYAGNTAQGLADLLFKDDWSQRNTPGQQAVLTYTGDGNEVTAVVIATAGTGYTDGVGYLVTVQGGGNDALIQYDVVAGAVTNATVAAPGTTYPLGSGFAVNDFPAPGLIFETQANAEEVSRANDLIAAMTAIHEVYQAADGGTVAAEDRLVQMRRFT